MAKKKCYNIFYGILFCMSISALVIACIAFTRNRGRDNYVHQELYSESNAQWVRNICA